jgi:ATP-dependent Clp protease ATP-binding subunit ClpX
MISVTTENILFICGGAFDGIEKVIEKRLDSRPIGFTSEEEEMKLKDIDKNNFLQYISSPDLKKFGLIPELIGRLPVVTHLNPLDKETLKMILTVPKNALTRQYEKLFKMEGIQLKIEHDALEFIVEKAMTFKLGARGLRSIFETVITEAMFELPSQEGVKEFEITRRYAQEQFEKSGIKQLKVA